MKSLKNKTVLLTAGPTFEPIDPVRFIGNRSSGKMGYAIASELANQDAKVILVSGPVHLTLEHPNVTIIKVQTAQEMYEAVHNNYKGVDIAIFTAAVADFTPSNPSNQKIKKKAGQDKMVLELIKTKDILKSIGAIKTEKQVVVGFALETNNAVENAKKKLVKKHLDFIVLNSLADKGAGFAYDTNKITIIDKHNNLINFELKKKRDVAVDIVTYLIQYINRK